MGKVKDITGKRFGRLVVIKLLDDRGPGRMTNWLCKCDCGNEKVVSRNSLISGRTKSCGCLYLETRDKPQYPLERKRIQGIWWAMKRRCYSKTNSHYKYYGGRGIKICDEWKEHFDSFYKWSIENGYKENLSIDRIDNDGDYCPENCRWVDDITQANNKRTNKTFKINGEEKTISEWCKEFGIKERVVRRRIESGSTFERAIDKDFKKRINYKSDKNKLIAEKCKESGIPYKVAIERVKMGWSVERATSESVRQYKRIT